MTKVFCNKKKSCPLAGFYIILLLSASACSPQNTVSMMNPNAPQIVEETRTEQRAVTEVTDSYLQEIAADFDRYATSPLSLSVSYDPNSENYSAMQAFQDVAIYREMLSKHGIKNIEATTVPVEGNETGLLLISYDTVKAQAGEGCTLMNGITGAQTTRDLSNYRFGCSIDHMMTAQVYRPSDLMGVSGDENPADGRRAANVVEYHRIVPESKATAPLDILGREEIKSE